MQTHYFCLFFIFLQQGKEGKFNYVVLPILVFAIKQQQWRKHLYWHAKKKTKYTQELPKFNFFSFTQMSLNYCMKSKLSSLIKNFFFSIFNGIVISLSIESAFFQFSSQIMKVLLAPQFVILAYTRRSFLHEKFITLQKVTRRRQ